MEEYIFDLLLMVCTCVHLNINVDYKINLKR